MFDTPGASGTVRTKTSADRDKDCSHKSASFSTAPTTRQDMVLTAPQLTMPPPAVPHTTEPIPDCIELALIKATHKQTGSISQVSSRKSTAPLSMAPCFLAKAADIRISSTPGSPILRTNSSLVPMAPVQPDSPNASRFSSDDEADVDEAVFYSGHFSSLGRECARERLHRDMPPWLIGMGGTSMGYSQCSGHSGRHG